MFTEGLDIEALRWINEKPANLEIGSETTFGSVDLDIPLSGGAKFLSGYGPRAYFSGIADNIEYNASVSENDLTTDSEEEIHGLSYSLSSSPSDDRILQVLNSSSSVKQETDVRRGYTEDDSCDSASTEASSTQVYLDNGVPSKPKFCTQSRFTDIEADKKNLGSKHGMDEIDDDLPSAPPICSPFPESSHHLRRTPSVGEVSPELERSSAPVNHDVEAFASSNSYQVRLPIFHASAQGPWLAVIAYEACVRLCLNAWARGCLEAPLFLENECSVLRDSFVLRQVLLQSEEELLHKHSPELSNEGAAMKPRNNIGKLKVQVRKVKMAIDPPAGCALLRTISFDSIQQHLSKLQYALSSRWRALRQIQITPRQSAKSFLSNRSLSYIRAGAQYLKQVSALLRSRATSLRSSSLLQDELQETYSCLLRLKSSTEEDVIRMQPGSGESHMFFTDSIGDDLIVEVNDSKGRNCGRVLAQVASVADDPSDKLRWWSIYHEPEHELVGKIQLYITYSTSLDENNNLKCGSVAETVVYDLVLEVAMKVQQFRERNLSIHGQWKWLLSEFATYYGVSDAYSKLRYLSYIMDVATPTADCLSLIYDLMLPVVMQRSSKSTLSHQENRILGEIKDQVEQLLAGLFENYKSLDESSPSGLVDVFRPARGQAAPALQPAVKLYSLLHDILTPEAQVSLCNYFQVAARKRTRRHLAETDEYVNSETSSVDPLTMSTAYQKMKSVCTSIRNEISTDIQIHNQNVLPSFVDLPNLSTSIYSVELCNRLRLFLTALPPSQPKSPVADLVVSTANFQRDLSSWNINQVKGGVDAKDLFHLYIMVWIQDTRLSLLESCKLDKVKWSGVRTQHWTTPFIDDVYDRIKETLNDYDVIICRWPEYTSVLESALADIERAAVEALDKQYADVLTPLKDHLAPKRFGMKYVQKLTKRSVCSYIVPHDLGIFLNSMKRMLDVLRPKVESQLKSWASCIPDGVLTSTPGERLGEVTVMLRAKFRNYLQAVVEKLSENMKLQSGTRLKKILQESKETVADSDVRRRMQPLVDQLIGTIDHLHSVFETHVFIAICRGFWDRMGQDVLHFLENRKENQSWYKGSRIAVSILEDTFASEMQKLMGNALQEKDLEAPRSIMEVRSMLCKDVYNRQNYY